MTAPAALALAAARMAPLGWVAPPLGGPSRSARLIIAAILTALVFPSLAALLVADLALALVARPQPLIARAVAAAPLRLAVVVLAVAAGTLAATHALARALADAAQLKVLP